VTISGAWTALTTPAGAYGSNCLSDGNAGKGTKSVRFSPTFAAAGNFPLYLRWTSDATRATNVPVDIVDGNGATTTVVVNQQQQGGQWVLLGTYPFGSGSSGSVTLRNDLTNGTVVADAVGFDVPVAGLPVVSLWANNGLAAEPPSASAAARNSTLTVCRSGTLTSPLVVSLALTGTAVNGADYAALPAAVTIPAGSSLATLSLAPVADTLAEGDETASIRIVANAAYTLGTPTAASITLQDRPMDEWRFRHFPAQLANPAVTGDAANPAGDGLSNLAKYALGLDPNTANATGATTPGTVSLGGNDYLTLRFARVDAPDLSCVAEVSSDLSHWTRDAASVKETVLSDDGSSQVVIAQDLQPVQGGARRFIRLNITRPP